MARYTVKILFTGFTARGIGSKRLRQEYITASSLFPQAMRDCGFDVDVRSVKAGEDLSQYAAAFVLINPPGSFSSSYLIDSCYVMSRMGTKACLFLDDFLVNAAFASNAKSCTKDYDTWTTGLKRRGHMKNQSDIFVKLAFDIIKRVIAPRCPWKILAPFFPWGDPLKAIGRDIDARVSIFDPSCYAIEMGPKPQPVLDGLRQRKWVVAALRQPIIDATVKLFPDTQWGTLNFGGDNQILETELAEVYAKTWGMMIPMQEIAGVGWWRYRYILATQARMVIHGCQEDNLSMGEPFKSHSLKDIESLSDAGLISLSNEQLNWFNRNIWTQSKFLAFTEKFVEDLANGN